LKRFLFQKRVAAGKQEQVEVATLGERLADFPFIDAAAERLDDALVAQSQHRVVAGTHELIDARVRCLLRAMREDV
jgi:hypothetical protein